MVCEYFFDYFKMMFVIQIFIMLDITPLFKSGQIIRQISEMLKNLMYLISGAGIGALGHYTYKKIQPEKHIQHTKRQMIETYVSKNEIEKGYLINVLKAVGFTLRGFYHFGMGTRLEGFNYHETFLRTEEIKDDSKDIKHLYCIFSPTDNICGHPEIQHGGATATIIDQNMGELAILHSKEMVATAELSIKYKKPIRKDQYYVLQAEIIKREGRKIFIQGIIKDLETGQIKAETEGLFMTVNWNNQMTRILTKFFQAINYKDYTHEHHTKLQSEEQMKERKHMEHHSVKVHSVDSKIQDLEKIIHKLEEKQKLLEQAYERKSREQIQQTK